MIKVILFDIDGVLVDTTQTNLAFYQSFFSQNGYPAYNLDQMINDFHLTMKEIIIKHSRETSPPKIEKLMQTAIRTPYPQDLTTIPDQAQKIVQNLAKTYRLGLVTGRIKRGLDAFYDVFGGREYFSVIVSADDYTHPKPSPEPLLLALKKLHLEPDKAIYIGDQATDIEAAHAAGMKAIAFGPVHPPGAEAYITSFIQLPAAILEISK